MTTEKQKTSYMPLGKRTRNQIALMEELSEKNKRAQRKICTKKKNHFIANDSEEDVKVVSETEYMRRVTADNHVDRGRKIHERVLDDVIVNDEEYMQWLDCEYDRDNKQDELPGKIVVEISSKIDIFGGSENDIIVETDIFGGSENELAKNIVVETDILGGSENVLAKNIHVETEIFGGSGNESPKNIDIEIGPETFGLCGNAGNSKKGRPSKNRNTEIEYAPEKRDMSEKCGGSETGGRRKRIRQAKENVVDKRYLKWISCRYSKNVNRGESHKNIENMPFIHSSSSSSSYYYYSDSEDGVDRLREQLPKYRNVGIQCELERDCEPGEFRNAKNGDNIKSGRPRMDKNVVRDYKASSVVHSSSLPYYSSNKKGGYGKRGRSSKKWNNGSKFEPENIGCSANGGTRP